MTDFGINWRVDGIGEGVEVSSDRRSAVCRSLKELEGFVAEHGRDLSPRTARLLGIVAFYFALRDFGMGRFPGVLDRTARGLDSAYIIVQNRDIQSHITDGIDSIRECLFPIRGRSHDELLGRAYHYVRSQLLE
jgi:hypothetical protein